MLGPILRELADLERHVGLSARRRFNENRGYGPESSASPAKDHVATRSLDLNSEALPATLT